MKTQNEKSEPDLLAGVQGIIGEVVSSLCIQAADAHGFEDIIFIGSTLENNELLQQIIESYTLLNRKILSF